MVYISDTNIKDDNTSVEFLDAISMYSIEMIWSGQDFKVSGSEFYVAVWFYAQKMFAKINELQECFQQMLNASLHMPQIWIPIHTNCLPILYVYKENEYTVHTIDLGCIHKL